MTAELVYWNPLHTSTACIAKSWFGVRGGQGPLSSYPDTWLESECQGGIVFRACRARFVEPDFLRDPLQLTQTTLANRSEGFSGVCSQKAAVSYFAVFTAMSSFLLCLSDIQKLLADNLKWKIIHGKLATKVINKWFCSWSGCQRNWWVSCVLPRGHAFLKVCFSQRGAICFSWGWNQCYIGSGTYD